MGEKDICPTSFKDYSSFMQFSWKTPSEQASTNILIKIDVSSKKNVMAKLACSLVGHLTYQMTLKQAECGAKGA